MSSQGRYKSLKHWEIITGIFIVIFFVLAIFIGRNNHELLVLFLIIEICLLLLLYSLVNRQNKVNSSNTAVDDSSNNPGDMYTPAIILAEGLVERLKNKNLDNYLVTDYAPCEQLLTSEIKDPDSLYTKLNTIMLDIIRYLKLPSIVQLIIEKETGEIQSGSQINGQFSSQKYKKEIKVKLRNYSSPDSIIATLCHECTHYFMEYHQLDVSDTKLNEKRTDTLAILIGFHSIIIKGYTVTYVYNNPQNRNANARITFGYIPLDDCQRIEQYLFDLRNTILSSKTEENKLADEKAISLRYCNAVRALLEQISSMDLHKIANTQIATPEKATELQLAFMEYESRNVKDEISNAESAIEKATNLEEVQSIKKTILRIGEKIQQWSKTFQGL